MQAYDIAIIGAGPAGSTAALILARAGFNVASIIGHDGSPQADARGETLSPQIAPILARLQLTKETRLHQMPVVTSFVSVWGTPRETVRSALAVPDAATVCIDRSMFESALRAAAVERGANMLRGRVNALERESHVWRLILHTGEQIEANYVIDASGRGGRFARRSGCRLLALDKLIAITRVLEPAHWDTNRTVAIEAMPTGWLFTSLNASGSRIVSFFTDSDLWSASELRRADSMIEHVLSGSCSFSHLCKDKRHFVTRTWPAGTLILDRAAAQGLLAVGDAAQTRDPLSSQGIAAAMDDAESATTLLATHFDHALSDAIELHELARQRTIDRYLRERLQYYRAEKRWPDHAFWRRRHDPDETRRLSRVLNTPRETANENIS